MIDHTPPAVRLLIDAWRVAGSPAQASIAWPRDRWLAQFPGHRDVLHALPDSLDRHTVRDACHDATAGAAAAECAFLAVMAWGFGRVGYGPHRTHEILTQTPDASERLAMVATRLAEDGPLAAYRQLSDEGSCRLVGLGPAFGTKYLYFCQPANSGTRALILDRLVATWLWREGVLDVNPQTWRLPTYQRYLENVHSWATALQCQPDEVEFCIFRAMANEKGSQWG